MKRPRWKLIESTLVLDHPYLKVAENVVELPDGKIVNDYLTFEGLHDFVTVIPVLPDGKILMIKELAFPINELLTQFPEGLVDHGESIVEAAKRELFEETGYEAARFEELGTALNAHRRTKARQHVMLATGLKMRSTERGVENEQEIGLRVYSANEINEQVRSGKIIQINALAAWSQYLVKEV